MATATSAPTVVGLSTSSARAVAPVPVVGTASVPSTREQIAQALGVPSYQMERSYSSVRSAYTKFLAVEAALQKYETMKRDGTWPLAGTIKQRDIIEVFIAKTTHSTNKSAFAQVPKYPAMEKWLLADLDAPVDVDVWGEKDKTVQNCKALVEDYIHRDTSRKEKKLQQEQAMDKGEGSSRSAKDKGKKTEKRVEKQPKKAKKHEK